MRTHSAKAKVAPKTARDAWLVWKGLPVYFTKHPLDCVRDPSPEQHKKKKNRLRINALEMF